MPRVLLALLAVLAAGIGLVIARPWLYVVAGLLVLAAIGLWARDWWLEQQRQAQRQDARARASSSSAGEGNAAAGRKDDDLRSLGIMDVRPRKKKGEGRPRPEEDLEEAPPEEAPEEASLAEPSAGRPAGARGSEGEKAGAAEAGSQMDGPGKVYETPSREKDAPDESDEDAFEKDFFERDFFGDDSAEEEAAGAASSSEGDWSPPPAAGDGTHPPERYEALSALVRAARLAVGARAACLLAQEELALEYRIEALDADASAPPLEDVGATFSTESPLLSASAAHQAVARQSVGEDGVAPGLLGYYRQPSSAPPEVIALVPVPLSDDPVTRFLMLDGARDPLDARADALLRPFAKLFAQVLAPDDGDVPVPPPRQSSSPSALPANLREGRDSGAKAASAPSQNGHARGNGAGPHEEERPEKDSPPEGEQRQRPGEEWLPAEEAPLPEEAPQKEPAAAPRPRREIIAEEMERVEGSDLALALVYLNRAEAVAERGQEEVHVAERALRARLRQALPERARLEPFGELTFGVFLRRGNAEAERWAVAFQEELEEASDPLEGGVSVGLALMRGPEQSPEALRENATSALREAYTTGTCTILE